MVMVVESFRYRLSPRDWSNFFSKSKKNGLLDWDPLLGKGHLVLFFQIQITSSGMVKFVFKFVLF